MILFQILLIKALDISNTRNATGAEEDDAAWATKPDAVLLNKFTQVSYPSTIE